MPPCPHTCRRNCATSASRCCSCCRRWATSAAALLRSAYAASASWRRASRSCSARRHRWRSAAASADTLARCAASASALPALAVAVAAAAAAAAAACSSAAARALRSWCRLVSCPSWRSLWHGRRGKPGTCVVGNPGLVSSTACQQGRLAATAGATLHTQCTPVGSAPQELQVGILLRQLILGDAQLLLQVVHLHTAPTRLPVGGSVR